MGDPYGLRRVVRPKGALPQQAEVLDPHLPLGPDELSIEVERLNVDAASFRQLAQEAKGDAQRISTRVADIVRARGKMHNPVTGSGGMLIGRVAEVGPEHPAAAELKAGDRIATLVSLTLTPLVLQEIERVQRYENELSVIMIDIDNFKKLNDEFGHLLGDETLRQVSTIFSGNLRKVDIAGERVLVLGAGKSGSLACAQARKNGAHVTALDYRPDAPSALVHEGLADAAIAVDATQPLEVYARALQAGLYDLVVNCASVPGTEMGSILAARDGGEVLFFSMATSFTAAALGAEGVGKDVRLTIGNGYARGHAELALELVRSTPALQRLFAARVG